MTVASERYLQPLRLTYSKSWQDDASFFIPKSVTLQFQYNSMVLYEILTLELPILLRLVHYFDIYTKVLSDISLQPFRFISRRFFGRGVYSKCSSDNAENSKLST